ncbi:hypothetical protein IB685_01145 [Francisella tularensis subsp. novicida FSC159]|uniref:hypothetical protein n=1 Tax=Francisella tularensis TaxID=263 RepID=UPI001C0EC4D2|nr:hypothetical protein [Francisella tularensis]MBK2110786.1 hypothetical protein [Francisella tularensis subsp. novicida FSC159]
MQSNLINVDEMIFKDGNKIFEQAVEALEHNEILFEGQFSFLDGFTMKERNLDAQREIFRRFGYSNSDDIQSLFFEVGEEGWKLCFCVFGNRFEEIKDVRDAVIEYFKK